MVYYKVPLFILDNPICFISCPPSSVTTGGNQSTQRKPVMLGRGKLNNTLLTCDKGSFNEITAQSQNQTLVTVTRDMCTTTVPPVLLGPKILCWQITHITTVALKWWDELEGAALMMAFFTRHDEKWGINQSKVNCRRLLILNQPIEINMKNVNIF